DMWEVHRNDSLFGSTTLWEAINSEYLSEDKRQDLFKLFRSRKITVEQLTVTIIDIIESKEIKQQAELNFEGLRGEVSVVDLLDLEIVDEKTYKSMIDGKLSSTDVMKMDRIRAYLQGTSCVAGLILQPSNQKLSINEAQKMGILTPGTALCLLEAQAATGFIVDPLKNQKLTVEEALREKVIGPQVYEKLLSAERAVTGYKDPYTGQKISLFQAMKKDLIVKQHGIRLLEAQIATGGIIDPLKCLHLPLEVAYRKGYFDAELNQILTDPTDDTKGFFDPKTQENLTYMEMLSRCVKDKDTGLLLLPLNGTPKTSAKTDKTYTEAEIRQEFEKTFYKTGALKLEEIIEILTKYLGATNCIAGVRLESTKTVMSIYEAKCRGLLTPGTSLILLEAQAATGFVIDPVNNKKLSVEEAVDQGVVGKEWKKKLLSAERAVTGYKDPYTGNTISLFQALKKDLIVKDHGIRLLEAQIATGGIIDPVHSHRVPVQVAYQRGYFDEEMNHILSDPDDDTKGFFDPNTKENLTYLQLIERCPALAVWWSRTEHPAEPGQLCRNTLYWRYKIHPAAGIRLLTRLFYASPCAEFGC
uniref:Epiplakin 1 n=1 Tax=Xiphophorus couchianus TaxID=32473 RepID=A0A3B5MYH2_9TELE